MQSGWFVAWLQKGRVLLLNTSRLPFSPRVYVSISKPPRYEVVCEIGAVYAPYRPF